MAGSLVHLKLPQLGGEGLALDIAQKAFIRKKHFRISGPIGTTLHMSALSDAICDPKRTCVLHSIEQSYAEGRLAFLRAVVFSYNTSRIGSDNYSKTHPCLNY